MEAAWMGSLKVKVNVLHRRIKIIRHEKRQENVANNI